MVGVIMDDSIQIDPSSSTSPSHQSSSPVTLTPLSNFPLPPSYLLTIDSAKILLDCGASDISSEFTTSTATHEATLKYLNTLKELAPSLSLVILTHPLLNSLGLLPWLRSKCGLRCPVYATLPTREMGRWAVEEWVEQRSSQEKNEARNIIKSDGLNNGNASKKRKGKAKEDLDVIMKIEGNETETTTGEIDPWDVVWKVSRKDIMDAFLSVNAVRWTQPVHLSGPLKGYTLVAHRSGHTLGGSIYTLRPSLSSSLSPASSSSSLLYAPIFNHVKEHHLDGAALLNGAKIDEAMRRIGVVVVGAARSQIVNVKRADREKALMDLIDATLLSGGSVLLPTDPSGRLLELLVLLESHWSYMNLGRYPLVLISHTGKEVAGFVRSLTEWMGGQVGGTEGGERLLLFTHLKIFKTIDEMNAYYPSNVAKLILTVPATLSHGFSRTLFVDFAKNPSNVVILTQNGEEGTLAKYLWKVWNEKQKEGEKWGEGKVGKEVQLGETLRLEMRKKIYLAGEELEAYHAAELEALELQAKHEAALDRSRRMMQAGADSDSDSDSDNEGSDEEVEIQGEGGVVVRRRTGGFTGGAGAWDEFLDPSAGGVVNSTTRGGKQSFDIFVKGGYAKKGGMGDTLQRFKMFPVVERKRRVDVYGEAIDVEGWLKRGVEDEEFTKLAKVGVVIGKRSREEEEADLVKPDLPHRYTVETIEAALFCSLFVADMEGLSDGRALKTILPQINPRKLVIVNGDSAAVNDLATACGAVSSMTKDIFMPQVDECITVGEETKNFSVRLGDTIMASLKLSRVEDYDVAYISGTLHFDPESNIPVLERGSFSEPLIAAIAASQLTITNGIKNDKIDESKLIETSSSRSDLLPPLTPSLFIGDLKLTILKDRLKLLNIPSEFVGKGVLICGPAPISALSITSSTSTTLAIRGPKSSEEELIELSGGKIAVKKLGKGQLVLEGSMGETYFIVRKLIYSMHAAAG